MRFGPLSFFLQSHGYSTFFFHGYSTYLAKVCQASEELGVVVLLILCLICCLITAPIVFLLLLNSYISQISLASHFGADGGKLFC